MNTIKFHSIFYCLLLIAACGNNRVSTEYFKKEYKTIHNTKYFIITPVEAKIDFEISRPLQKDENILLCVPGAYTDLSTYGVDGLFICKGKSYNNERINNSLGGGIKIINNKVDIFPTNFGKLLNDSFIKTITTLNGIFFQQTQCIVDHVSEKFRDQKLFQRRGIITLKNGTFAIVESEQAITLRQFSEDMVTLGAKDLLNFDMGSWDEGWYRDPETNKVTVMGQNKTQTDKQSNWVVLKKKL